jgi:hypothetical protein
MTALDLRARLERAHRELCEAVKRQWDGKPAFKLSIPARPDEDSDLVIGSAITDALAFLQPASAREIGQASTTESRAADGTDRADS